jgi:hypothetical protein
MVWGDSSVSFPKKMSVLLLWSLRLCSSSAVRSYVQSTTLLCAVKTRRTKDSRERDKDRIEGRVDGTCNLHF